MAEKQTTVPEVVEQLLETTGKQVQGFVLELRNNPAAPEQDGQATKPKATERDLEN